MIPNEAVCETVVAVQAPSTAVNEIEDLNEEEFADRQQLEMKIEQAFYEAGKALAQLRDRRLYRSTHKKFEDYCRDRFRFSRDKADLMIKAVEVVDNLKNDDNCRHFLPTAESQVRDIADLTPIRQCQVYAAAIEEVGSKVPPRRVIKDIMERLKECNMTPIKNPYSEGDLVKIRADTNPSQRKYDGYWGVVIHKATTSCKVHISVKKINIECNLSEMDKVEPKYTADIRAVNKRITSLIQKDNLSCIAIGILEILGQRSCFSPDDLWFLEKVEERYGG